MALLPTAVPKLWKFLGYRFLQKNMGKFGKMCVTVELIEGSLEVKLPTIWTDEKQSREEAERRERSEGKKMQMREKVGMSRTTVFFQ